MTGLRVSCSRPWPRVPARNALWAGAVDSPAPQLPCPAPGRGSHLPLGPASRCHRASGVGPPRALPGEKEKPVDGRRALTRHLLCGERRAARPGWGGRRAEGGPGEVGAESAQLPSPAPRGTRKAGWGAAGGGRAPGVGGRRCPLSPGINYCLGVLVPARAASEAQRPPSRLSVPRRKRWGWEPAGKAGLGWLGIRGPEVRGGSRGRGGECRVGEGPGNCGRGWEGPRGPVGGEEMGREPPEAGKDGVAGGRPLKPRPGPPRGPSSREVGAALTFSLTSSRTH